MTRTLRYFLGTMEVDTDQFVVSGLSIIANGPLLLEYPETWDSRSWTNSLNRNPSSLFSSLPPGRWERLARLRGCILPDR